MNTRKKIFLTGKDQGILEEMGVRIKRARLRRNLTQEEMSKRAGVTRKTYVSLEKGEQTVGLALLIKTLSILGLEDALLQIALVDPVGEALADQQARSTAANSASNVADF